MEHKQIQARIEISLLTVNVEVDNPKSKMFECIFAFNISKKTVSMEFFEILPNQIWK